jgi:hypothetical protein
LCPGVIGLSWAYGSHCSAWDLVYSSLSLLWMGHSVLSSAIHFPPPHLYRFPVSRLGLHLSYRHRQYVLLQNWQWSARPHSAISQRTAIWILQLIYVELTGKQSNFESRRITCYFKWPSCPKLATDVCYCGKLTCSVAYLQTMGNFLGHAKTFRRKFSDLHWLHPLKCPNVTHIRMGKWDTTAQPELTMSQE